MSKPLNPAKKSGRPDGKGPLDVPEARGFVEDPLKGDASSLTSVLACEDEPVYRIARRKKTCVGRFGDEL